MKKIIVNILFVFGVTTAASAQAYDPVPIAVTPANQPENNAFFRTAHTAYSNEVYKSYWAWDTRTVGWVKRVEVVVPEPIPVITSDPRSSKAMMYVQRMPACKKLQRSQVGNEIHVTNNKRATS